jgi:CRP-like cAMP-binding protein
MGTLMSPASGATVPLTQKLAHFMPLAADEIPLLRDLQAGSRLFRRGQELIVEGKSYRTLFVVNDGFAVCYRVLRDGRRQVLIVLLPGDIAGALGCFFENALYSVRTLTDLWASPVPVGRLMHLFQKQPQLAAKLFWSFSCEAAIYAEHLIAVGRRTALERVGHFLLELLTRLQNVQLADERSFCLPLTQELIADALGLSIPYVNQVLRSLRDEGLVHIKDKIVLIDDVAALAAMVDFEHHYLKPLSINDLLSEAS